MTVAEMIKQYIECRDWLDADNKKQQERHAPVLERMKLLEGAVTEEINRLGGQSIKTDAGTAFRQEWTAAKVADRELFMDFVFDGRREGFLTSNISKEAVKEYLDTNQGALPPGVDFTRGYKTVFRRSKE